MVPKRKGYPKSPSYRKGDRVIFFWCGAEAQQSPPSAAFQSMVTTVHQQLTPNMYTFIFDASTHEDEEDQNQAPNAEKKARKAKKEGKQIGLLVKAIEEWEFNLIKLTRSCKHPAFCYVHLSNCCFISSFIEVFNHLISHTLIHSSCHSAVRSITHFQHYLPGISVTKLVND